VRSRVLPPNSWGELHTENRCRHGKYLKMRRYPRGSVALCSFASSLSVIRGAFCIVPVQASGIFGQVPLACACHSLVCLPCCSRLCAHPLAAAHPPLSALELSRSRLLTHPLATLYLPLSHLHLSPQSPSLNARSRLNMPVLILLRHRRAGSIEDTHFLASFFTLPPSPWVLLHVRHRPHRNPSL